jgi:hypothetical protein
MAADVARYQPFATFFHQDVLASVPDLPAAQRLESCYIHHFGTRAPAGYNTLPANPGRSRQYWFLRRRGII